MGDVTLYRKCPDCDYAPGQVVPVDRIPPPPCLGCNGRGYVPAVLTEADVERAVSEEAVTAALDGLEHYELTSLKNDGYRPYYESVSREEEAVDMANALRAALPVLLDAGFQQPKGENDERG